MAEAVPLMVVQSEVFAHWLERLRDRQAMARILARIDALRAGNPGDAKALGEGLVELRIHAGPGYRLYCTRIGARMVVLLCGGDKSSQQRDIVQARDLARLAREELDGTV